MEPKKLTVDELNGYETFLFDADGVLWRGGCALPGAVEFVQRLKNEGKRIFVITNNSTKTRSQYLKKLQELGFDLPESNVISPGVVLPVYLKDNGYEKKKIYLIGTHSLRQSLETGAGVECFGLGPDHFEKLTDTDFIFDLDNEKDVAAVVVSFDGHIGYPKIMRAANYLKDPNIGFFITNEDYTFPGPRNDLIVPGTGCIAAAIRSVVDREPIVFGKPNSPIADFLKKHHHIEPKTTIMFGDRLDTDMEFANRNGFTSCLMLTGVHNFETVERAHSLGKIASRLRIKVFKARLGPMWPLMYALGQRFSYYLVFPVAAVIGTIGYYAEKKLRPKQAPIPYLEQSIIEARERRLKMGQEFREDVDKQRARTLHIAEPTPER